MFGYVVINQPDITFREFDIYRSYYCGLCRELKERFGGRGQLTLSYDMTFLVMLLTGLYEPESVTGECRCAAHPFERHATRRNECSSYVADMNILLSYYQCIDDWEDDRKLKKLAFSKLLRKKSDEVRSRFPEKTKKIVDNLKVLKQYEKEENRDIDMVAGCFGSIMAELMVYRQDIWEEHLRRIGFYLGKYIYLLDAYEDLESDKKNGRFNPFIEKEDEPGFEDECKNILTMMMAQCSKEFELLPIIENVNILRNILYSGVWSRYEIVRRDREKR